MESTQDRMLLINKPKEWTSFDVVNKLRYRLKIKKIGHAGTLDPLATGLLIICTGKLTRRIDEFQGQEKEYTGKMVIGQTTPSYDLETVPSEPLNIDSITDGQIRDAANRFRGVLSQVPPAHSAIKVGGRRAYDLARNGRAVELKARQIFVREFDITGFHKPCINFRVVCTKGTYIRSLVHDFGNALGVGAYLAELCRTRIGNFRLEDALEIEQVEP